MLEIHLSAGELLIASEIAFNDTLSRKVSKISSFLPILRLIVCAILCKAVSVEVPLF